MAGRGRGVSEGVLAGMNTDDVSGKNSSPTVVPVAKKAKPNQEDPSPEAVWKAKYMNYVGRTDFAVFVIYRGFVDENKKFASHVLYPVYDYCGHTNKHLCVSDRYWVNPGNRSCSHTRIAGSIISNDEADGKRYHVMISDIVETFVMKIDMEEIDIDNM